MALQVIGLPPSAPATALRRSAGRQHPIRKKVLTTSYLRSEDSCQRALPGRRSSMIATRRFAPLLGSLLTCSGCCRSVSAAVNTQDDLPMSSAARHQSAGLAARCVPHLPDPATATPAELELAADVLRARRMPEDALDYYGYALNRGGDEATLSNQHRHHHAGTASPGARSHRLQTRACRSSPKTPRPGTTWVRRSTSQAAIGLPSPTISRPSSWTRRPPSSTPTWAPHTSRSRTSRAHASSSPSAVKLDPTSSRDSDLGGIEAHVLSPDRSRPVLLRDGPAVRRDQHDDAAIIRWLGKASEAGFDVRDAMNGDQRTGPLSQGSAHRRHDPVTPAPCGPDQVADSGPRASPVLLQKP